MSNRNIWNDESYQARKAQLQAAVKAVQECQNLFSWRSDRVREAEAEEQRRSGILYGLEILLSQRPDNIGRQCQVRKATTLLETSRRVVEMAKDLLSEASRDLFAENQKLAQLDLQLGEYVKKWEQRKRGWGEQEQTGGAEREEKPGIHGNANSRGNANSGAGDQRTAGRTNMQKPSTLHHEAYYATAIENGRKLTIEAFSDRAAMRSFPEPPSAMFCTKPACLVVGWRQLKACPYNVKTTFEPLRGLDLKKERLEWHPDRFSTCQEELREEFQAKAREVFVVVDGMYRAGK